MLKQVITLILLATITQAGAQDASAWRLVDSLYAVGNYSAAIQELEKWETESPKISLMLARAHQAKGTLNKALENYKWVSAEAGQTIAATEYSKLLLATEKHKVADSVLTTLIASNGENPNYYYLRGLARKEMKINFKDTAEVREAIEREAGLLDFEKAVTLDSTHQKALYESAYIFIKYKKYKLAEERCNMALRAYPNNTRILSLQAQNYYNRGYIALARPVFEKLIALGKGSAYVHNRLGQVYAREKRHQDAVEQFIALLGFNEDDYNAHFLLAKSYKALGNFQKAEEHLIKSISLKDLPLTEEYNVLSETYREQKEFEKAMKYVNLAIAENPEDKKNVFAYYNKAVIADNYYKDREAVVKLYEESAAQFEKHYKMKLPILERRLKELREEAYFATEE
ncbi:MAG: tetratricopeptide repeat protein [Leeuwenhoekiella sp.]